MELLVVIGIIALLISVLLPVLGKARESASNAKCLSNLRSIGQAIYLYSVSSKGYVVPGYIQTTDASGQNRRQSWASLLVVTKSVPGVAGPDAKLSNDSASRASIFQCPNQLPNAGTGTGVADPTTMKDGNGAAFWRCFLNNDNGDAFVDTSYGVNAATNYSNPTLKKNAESLVPFTSLDFASPGAAEALGLAPKKLSTLRRPAKMAMIFDGSQRLGARIARINMRHHKNTTSNFLFADGHVETIHERAFTKLIEAAVANGGQNVNLNLLQNPAISPDQLTAVFSEFNFRTDQR